MANVNPFMTIAQVEGKIDSYLEGYVNKNSLVDSEGIDNSNNWNDSSIPSLGSLVDTDSFVLMVESVDDLKNLSILHRNLLSAGFYKSVRLLGYYEKGDTPDSIDYKLSNTDDDEDGGSIFDLNGIKLEHKFVGNINVRYFGAREGVEEDQSSYILNALSYNNGSTVEIDGEYYIDPSTTVYRGGGIIMPTDSSIIGTNVKSRLIALKTDEESGAILATQKNNNISIMNLELIGERNLHEEEESEHMHGISIYDSDNVFVYNVTCRDTRGDGIYISSGNSNIRVYKSRMDNNRRQGMSVISCVNLHVKDCIMSNTNGAMPQSGIDVEPNSSNDKYINVLFENITTIGNERDGITISPKDLGGSEETHDITFRNIKSIDDGNSSLRIFHSSQIEDKENALSGVITIDGLHSVRSGYQSLSIYNYDNGLDVDIKKVRIYNPILSGAYDKSSVSNSGIFIRKAGTFTEDRSIPNVYIDDVIIKSTLNDNMTYGITMYGSQNATIDNLFITNVKEITGYESYLFYGSNMGSNWKIEWDKVGSEQLESDTFTLNRRGFNQKYTREDTTSDRSISFIGVTPINSWTELDYGYSDNIGKFGIKLTSFLTILGIPESNDEFFYTEDKGAYLKVTKVSEDFLRIDDISGRWFAGDTEYNFNNVKTLSSSDTASQIGDNYDKEEVQGILDELRDLKQKMRDSNLLKD